ncbi:hypothetical protein BB559_001014 [Furculomyces boomerangus]|uniref:Uncharacterized protein n=2 Tax=Harpellales TaxID=61421 RepID=A0A2T9Z3C3_9FUNG|nr:hypothetical protein BB559_001014 [Furculomyces boomerangus]PWA02959.1 hypothetical protein BB558_000868 [Smittium angustum]
MKKKQTTLFDFTKPKLPNNKGNNEQKSAPSSKTPCSSDILLSNFIPKLETNLSITKELLLNDDNNQNIDGTTNNFQKRKADNASSNNKNVDVQECLNGIENKFSYFVFT